MLNFIFVLLFFIEVYIFFILKSVYSGNQFKIAFAIQLALALFTFISLLYTSKTLGHGLSQTTKPINLLLGLFVTFGVAKLVFISVIFLEDVTRFFRWIFSFFGSDITRAAFRVEKQP